MRETFQAEPYKAEQPTLFMGGGSLWVLAHEDGSTDANMHEGLFILCQLYAPSSPQPYAVLTQPMSSSLLLRAK